MGDVVELPVKPEIREAVPEAAIVAQFGYLYACSPEIYEALVKDLADRFKVSVDDLHPYISEVLKKLPPVLD